MVCSGSERTLENTTDALITTQAFHTAKLYKICKATRKMLSNQKQEEPSDRDSNVERIIKINGMHRKMKAFFTVHLSFFVYFRHDCY